jgi:hypothetical protein
MPSIGRTIRDCLSDAGSGVISGVTESGAASTSFEEGAISSFEEGAISSFEEGVWV